jgi:hypothetical protein
MYWKWQLVIAAAAWLQSGGWSLAQPSPRAGETQAGVRTRTEFLAISPGNLADADNPLNLPSVPSESSTSLARRSSQKSSGEGAVVDEAPSVSAQPITAEEVERMIAASEKKRAEAAKEDAEQAKKKDKEKKPEPKKWYEKVAFRGYSQFRFNQELFEDEPSAPAHYIGDRSVSEDQSFFIRRARLIFFGDVHEHLYVYFQPDFANTPPGSTDLNQFVQIRDLYGDVYLDKEKEFRLRVGQSKIPYGWENMQSSQNRIPLDRTDAINSAARNERDLGVFFYYTPKSAQTFFKEVVDEGLKGSGNYGVFAFGAYNGQGGSFIEQNDNLHLVSRITLPYTFCDGQRMETAFQGYIGEYVVLGSGIRQQGVGANTFRPAGTVDTGNPDGWNDKRLAATWVWYPQPLGFQAEWNVGRGPALNELQSAIEDRALQGGYLMTMYKADTDFGTCFPFCRWAFYEGGVKAERNAPYAHINEWEFGNEWQINTATELTLAYLITDRTNTNAATQPQVAPYQQFDGHVMRMQFQINY